MVGAIRVVSVERGHDPRSFALVPFGGAGPLHGCALAEILGITTVLVPPAPGVLCAEGLLAADLKAEWSRTLPTAGAVSDDEASAILLALHAEATAWLKAEAVPPADRSTEEVALLRYAGQGGELAVPWGGSVGAAQAGFVAAHQAQYGFVLTAAVELVTLRVEATGALPDAVLPSLSPGDLPEPVRTLPVHFAGGTADTPLYDRAALPAGVRLAGPTILLQLDATTLIPPGWHAEVHRSAAIILRRHGETI